MAIRVSPLMGLGQIAQGYEQQRNEAARRQLIEEQLRAQALARAAQGAIGATLTAPGGIGGGVGSSPYAGLANLGGGGAGGGDPTGGAPPPGSAPNVPSDDGYATSPAIGNAPKANATPPDGPVTGGYNVTMTPGGPMPMPPDAPRGPAGVAAGLANMIPQIGVAPQAPQPGPTQQGPMPPAARAPIAPPQAPPQRPPMAAPAAALPAGAPAGAPPQAGGGGQQLMANFQQQAMADLLNPERGYQFAKSIALQVKAANPNASNEVIAMATKDLITAGASQDKVGLALALANMRAAVTERGQDMHAATAAAGQAAAGARETQRETAATGRQQAGFQHSDQQLSTRIQAAQAAAQKRADERNAAQQQAASSKNRTTYINTLQKQLTDIRAQLNPSDPKNAPDPQVRAGLTKEYNEIASLLDSMRRQLGLGLSQ